MSSKLERDALSIDVYDSEKRDDIIIKVDKANIHNR